MLALVCIDKALLLWTKYLQAKLHFYLDISLCSPQDQLLLWDSFTCTTALTLEFCGEQCCRSVREHHLHQPGKQHLLDVHPRVTAGWW